MVAASWLRRLLLQCCAVQQVFAGLFCHPHFSSQLRSRATTLQQYVWTAEQLEAVTLRLLRAELPLDLRLMGVRRVLHPSLPPPGLLLARVGLHVLQRLSAPSRDMAVTFPKSVL